MMGGNSSIVRFAPKKRLNCDVSSAPADITDAERVVIRELARRAARKWLAEIKRVPSSSEPDER